MSLDKIQQPLTKIFDILKVLVSKDILQDLSEHLDGLLCSPEYLWHTNINQDHFGFPKRFRLVEKCNVPFSASGIFTGKQANNAIETIKTYNPDIKRIFFIDLLKEYHFFIDHSDNQFPLSFRAEKNVVNYGVPYEDVEKLERIIYKNLADGSKNTSIKFACWFETHEGSIKNINKSIIKTNANFYTERDLIEKLSDVNEVEILYKRFPCMDHMAPTHKAIISFASFIQNDFNPETDWLHIHCHGGSGRSTSFSVIYDMFMKIRDGNLNNISFQSLIEKHKDSGGRDLNGNSTKDWKKAFAEQRYTTLENIYKNLIIIENHGLQDVFSTALTMMLLKQDNSLYTQSLQEFISGSGNNVIERVNTDPQLYNKLSDFYNEYYDLGHADKLISEDILTLDQTENTTLNDF